MSATQPDPVAWTGLPPAPGRLLVAAPILTELTFERTVIYLLEHDLGGTVGLILNRPSHTPVGQVLPSWGEAVGEPAVVFAGGPVQVDGALCLGRSTGDSAATRALGGGLCTVDLGGDVGEATAATSGLRVFAGHSGWSGGQLAGELAQGAWFVVEGSVVDAFTERPEQLWRQVLLRQPPPLLFMANYPKDPALN